MIENFEKTPEDVLPVGYNYTVVINPGRSIPTNPLPLDPKEQLSDKAYSILAMTSIPKISHFLLKN